MRGQTHHGERAVSASKDARATAAAYDGFLLTLDATCCARCQSTLTIAEIIEKHCITCTETERAGR